MILNKTSMIFASVLFSVILIAGFTMSSYADYISPKKQMESGIAINDIQCRDDRVLVLRAIDSPACVSERTAERTGWEILKTEFIHTEKLVIMPEPTITPEQVTPTIIMIDQSSDVEFEDDGREIFRSKLQASAPPRNFYDTIMSALSNSEFKNDGEGNITLTSVPHEKYSVKEGVGLYLEDWLPEFVPNGQRLLYSGTDYSEKYASYSLTHQYVPTTFEVTPEITTFDMKNSKGFTIMIKKTTVPLPAIEGNMERHKSILTTQEGNVGGYVDMTRDGQTVSAYSGSNKYNHYQATLGFYPDEYTSIGVRSNYHTLEELLPIFESIMN